jgi:hypothetical protein
MKGGHLLVPRLDEPELAVRSLQRAQQAVHAVTRIPEDRAHSPIMQALPEEIANRLTHGDRPVLRLTGNVRNPLPVCGVKQKQPTIIALLPRFVMIAAAGLRDRQTQTQGLPDHRPRTTIGSPRATSSRTARRTQREDSEKCPSRSNGSSRRE